MRISDWSSDVCSSDLRAADPASLFLGVLIVQSQIVLSAMRWRFTAGRLGMRLTRGRAVGEYYVATFLNQVLPGGVAGDALRTWRNRAPIAAAEAGAEGPTGWSPRRKGDGEGKAGLVRGDPGSS